MDERQPAEDIAAMGAPASPDALKEIVARHQRGRTRTLGIALAIALVAGPAAGWAIGQSGGGGQQVATGTQPDASPAAAPQANAQAGAVSGGSAEAFAVAGPNALKLTPLFNRTTADGISIRAYEEVPATPTTGTTVQPPKGECTMAKSAPGTATAQANSGAVASANASSGSTGSAEGGQTVAPTPAQGADSTAGPGTVISGTASPPCPGVPPVCRTTPSVLSEFSNQAAVGQNFAAIDKTPPSDALSHLAVSEFGVRELAPAVTVTVQTGPGGATVRLRVPSGSTDEMAPFGNVAVLAASSPAPPPDGTVVEALDSSGEVLASMPLSGTGNKMGVLCGVAGNIAVAPAPAAPPTTR